MGNTLHLRDSLRNDDCRKHTVHVSRLAHLLVLTWNPKRGRPRDQGPLETHLVHRWNDSISQVISNRCRLALLEKVLEIDICYQHTDKRRDFWEGAIGWQGHAQGSFVCELTFGDVDFVGWGVAGYCWGEGGSKLYAACSTYVEHERWLARRLVRDGEVFVM